MRSALTAALLSAALSLPAPLRAQEAGTGVTFSLPQARAAAQQALLHGNYPLALNLGRGLIEADPEDGTAHYIVATAQAGLGNAREGRRAARLAHRKASRDTDRFIAAQVAARLSLREEHYTLAQYWLRRSLDTAPSEQARAQVISDYKRLRSLKKFGWSASASLAPSDNVNSGTDDTELTIDGVPIVGLLDSASQPLSGVVGKLDLDLSYKLSRSERAEWQAKARLFHREVWLSSEARTAAPGVSNSDLATATYELGAERTWLSGQKDAAALNKLSFTLGQNHSGREKHSDTATLAYTRQLRLSQDAALSYGAHVRKIFYNSAASLTGTQTELRGGYSQTLGNGDLLQAGLVLSQTNSRRGNTSNSSVTAHLRYGFGKQFGPAKLSLTLGARHTDYPRYFVGLIGSPDGREDTNYFGSVGLRFVDYERAGFIPTASLRYQATSSNISRFTFDGAHLSIGFASSF
ncbi:DUF560 domain-containing protein [Rhodobacteraceae bacterium 63075]|nr:DUF560 domain-containing protein [Rhodobacteraceae bacterium 63075]